MRTTGDEHHIDHIPPPNTAAQQRFGNFPLSDTNVFCDSVESVTVDISFSHNYSTILLKSLFVRFHLERAFVLRSP